MGASSFLLDERRKISNGKKGAAHPGVFFRFSEGQEGFLVLLLFQSLAKTVEYLTYAFPTSAGPNTTHCQNKNG